MIPSVEGYRAVMNWITEDPLRAGLTGLAFFAFITALVLNHLYNNNNDQDW